MILSEQLSVVQNFIIFENQKDRLDLICSDIGVKTTANILDGCSFYVNYKNNIYLDEVRNAYESNIENLSMFNNLDGDDFHWADITLQLVRESKTPYVMLITEDRMFTNTTKDYFYNMIKDFVSKKVNYMAIGKLHEYTSGSKHKDIRNFPKVFNSYYDGGEYLWLYKAKNSPNKSFSADAIYERELLIEKLEKVISPNLPKMSPRGYPVNRPHFFEDHYTDAYGNGIRNCGDMLCATPKKEIIVSDETPGFKQKI